MEKMISFEPWFGEFGWEIMSWVPIIRKKAAEYNKVTVCSFDGMGPLYADFADEFIAHGEKGRRLDYPKIYRHEGIFHRYGEASKAEISADILIHARGVNRKNSINYKYWSELLRKIDKNGFTAAFIGSENDDCVLGYLDFRGIDLAILMNRIAVAKLVIGVSSGVMHLAAACGTDIVVWGDDRTYFGETLEKRYKMTWNPFEVRVGWITDNNWQPEPERIIDKIKILLRKTVFDMPLRDPLRKVI